MRTEQMKVFTISNRDLQAEAVQTHVARSSLCTKRNRNWYAQRSTEREKRAGAAGPGLLAHERGNSGRDSFFGVFEQ